MLSTSRNWHVDIDLTTQTIRRDINALCDLGHARRFHGGVDLPVEGSNISLNARAQLNSGAKRLIAKRVARRYRGRRDSVPRDRQHGSVRCRGACAITRG